MNYIDELLAEKSDNLLIEVETNSGNVQVFECKRGASLMIANHAIEIRAKELLRKLKNAPEDSEEAKLAQLVNSELVQTALIFNRIVVSPSLSEIDCIKFVLMRVDIVNYILSELKKDLSLENSNLIFDLKKE